MPFIDLKITEKLTEDKKERIMSGLGKSIGIMRKPESYLMVGIADGYSLYFAGKKLEKGAFVSISVFGEVKSSESSLMTSAICGLLKDELDIDGDCVYVTYGGVENWGFDGANF